MTQINARVAAERQDERLPSSPRTRVGKRVMKNQPPEFAGKVLDALSSHIAVLDADGVIIGVNDAWRRFCDRNGGTTSGYYVQENYVAMCDRAAAATRDPAIASVGQALRSILEGEREHFAQEYPCNSASE